MKKVVFFLILFLPVLVFGSTYEEFRNTAGNYMDTGDYKFSYDKYIYTPTNNSEFYNSFSPLFLNWIIIGVPLKSTFALILFSKYL